MRERINTERRDIERFQTFDTVEVFSKRGGFFWNDGTVCDKKRGFVIDYVIDIESNTYDSILICINNNESPMKFGHGLDNVITCRMVLTEKFDKKMENARLRISGNYD